MAASLFPLATPVPTTKVSFGTTLSRELLPLKPPHTRAGNELGLRGQPNLGPGVYNNNEVSSFVYKIDQKPVSKKGYSLGSRTAPRFNKETNAGIPGPPSYQPIISKSRKFIQAYRPFQCGSAKLPSLKQDATPGAGAYEHQVAKNRKVQFHGAFGGPQTLKTSITLICHNGDPDICASCLKMPNGDYYRSKSKALCRDCYFAKMATSQAKSTKRRKEEFIKVRDCTDVHGHEGTNAKLRLMSEKDIKKLRTREAYMSLYY
ncbi:ciliary microtubule-associated protein 3-like [Rhopilema esculentum]|uniref:ciliary microtubule-associated protein 3-like n=1 Tax=Rhopilema esculentum TaxID=499914 RepID=UPI0031CE45BB